MVNPCLMEKKSKYKAVALWVCKNCLTQKVKTNQISINY